jgi:hypothetical protein
MMDQTRRCWLCILRRKAFATRTGMKLPRKLFERCEGGHSKHSPGTDVAAVSPVPGADVALARRVPVQSLCET